MSAKSQESNKWSLSHLNSDFSALNWTAISPKKKNIFNLFHLFLSNYTHYCQLLSWEIGLESSLYSTAFLLNTATIRQTRTKLTQILWRDTNRITRHHSAKLQITKQTLTTSKHSIEFTNRDFACHINEQK